jgi:nicotinate phosphoribosyltransferase
MKSDSIVLLTDLYEFTMAEAYYQQKMFAPATFSLFIREYPKHRGYFVSAGLEEVLQFLESFSFSQEDLDYLSQAAPFSEDFLHHLSSLSFKGEVFAMPEGRLFFRDEPILEITAPIIQAQLVETFVINSISLQVTIASKAARCVHAADGRTLVDFSLRRTQGTDAGLKVARASYIAGFSSTSNVLAGKRYGIPVSGTMAHSFITSFEEEIESFRAFAQTFPDKAVLLIDTYDTLTGAEKAVTVAKEMESRGEKLRGVRLDSGDMVSLSKKVREFFQEAGFGETSIFASGGFDEFKIAEHIEKEADIDGFGVGTKMGVSADAPYLDIAYKLVQYDGRPVLKLSSGKKTLVGEKQVFRVKEDGSPRKDIIALREEDYEGEPLLDYVMKDGTRQKPPEPLAEIKERFHEEFSTLPAPYKLLENPEEFPVELGPHLRKAQQEVIQEVKEKELGES